MSRNSPRDKTYRGKKSHRYVPKSLDATAIIRWLRAPIDTSWISRLSEMGDEELARIFRDPTKHGYAMKNYIAAHAKVKDLIAALGLTSTPRERAILLEILGWHGTPQAIPAMVGYISNRSPNVRSEAADAIGKIALRARCRTRLHAVSTLGSPPVGEIMLARFVKEQEHGKQNCWLAAALGSIDYRPAIPALIRALESQDASVRGCAAWSLGILHAIEAMEPLQTVYMVETESYPKNRMSVALREIEREQEKHGN